MATTGIADYFIPHEVRSASVSEYFRARILVSSCLAAAAGVFPFVFIRLYLNGPRSAFFLILVACTVLLAATPFVLKFTRSVVTAGLLVTLSSSLVLIVFSFLDGGFRSSSVLWMPILPLFTVFFAGRRFGLLSAAIIFADLVFLFHAHVHGYVPPVEISEEQMAFLYFLSTTVVVAVLLVLAFLYLAWQYAVQSGLRQASKAKSDFLSAMSHELRTPLNAIIGFTDVLSRGYAGPLNDRQMEYATYIRSSSRQLLDLVRDVLDLAKVEAGKTEFSPTPVRVDAMLAESTHPFQQKAGEKRIALTQETGAPLAGIWASVDERKFKQILYNLISNAVKFTPEGGQVVVAGTVVDDTLVVRVEDTGPGIAPEDRERVFESFFQASQHPDQQAAGTGLGLAICRAYARLHGGSIRVESPAGGTGARFVLEVPLRRTAPPKADSV